MLHGLSLVAVSRGSSAAVALRLLIAGFLLFQSTSSRAQTQELGCTGFVAPWHRESSWIKHVSPALAGGFLTTGPPGKPPGGSLKKDSRGGIFSEILRSVPWLT